MQDEDVRLRKAEKSMDYIQNIIDRLANDQFKIKSLSVTFSTVFVTFIFKYHGLHNYLTMVIAALLILSLAFTDTVYLINERKYRKLYEKAMLYANRQSDIYTPYSLKVESKLYLRKIIRTFLQSPTIYIFYIAQLVVLAVLLGFK